MLPMRHIPIATACLLPLFASAPAAAYSIDDYSSGPLSGNTYWGADAHGWGDVIGNKDLFDIYGMNVEFNGTALTVDIYTNFAVNGANGAGRADDGLFAGYTNTPVGQGKGIGLGDLFLQYAPWQPDASGPNGAHYANDDAADPGNIWTWALSLDNRWGTGGNLDLFKLNGATNDANATLSNDYFGGGVTYRNGQEVAVDRNSANVTEFANNGTWSITGDNVANDQDDFIRFYIDLAGTDLGNSLAQGGYLSLHWGLTCANDVVEGGVEFVPEPGSLALVASAFGLLVAGARRRRA